MKKQFIVGFACGAALFGAVGAFAGQYIATDNPFPIQLNGNNVQIEGYNIEGSTYFKLRDIADTVGGFDVDFKNDTILLSKDGYIYADVPSERIINLNDLDMSAFAGTALRLQQFSEADIGSEDFLHNFIFYYYTGKGDPNGESYRDGYFYWDEEAVRQDYKLLFGSDMPVYHPVGGESVIYVNGQYGVRPSDYGDVMYVYKETVNIDDGGADVIYAISDSSGSEIFGTAVMHILPADNANGFVITSKN